MSRTAPNASSTLKTACSATTATAKGRTDDEELFVSDLYSSSSAVIANEERDGLLRRTRFRVSPISTRESMRPYWLGLGLFLILFAFWLLDSLKDPIFAILVEGKLDQNQPPAKLCSVTTTLIIVSMVELGAYARKQQRNAATRLDEWKAMPMEQERSSDVDRVSAAVFAYVGVSYAIAFAVITVGLGYHPAFSADVPSFDAGTSTSTMWHVVGYALYSVIESFGSLAVATFWSYTNSNLSLQDAERFYGLIIAIAQVGAIGGSTMVTTQHWSTTSLMWVACLVIILQVLVMMRYDRVYKNYVPDEAPQTLTPVTEGPAVLWSGVYLILQHNYVLMIMGVSCLYEVSLTCLDYQMKLLGWSRFEERHSGISFAQFMGRYGQVTNFTSLLISSVVFPFLIRRLGLRYTVRIFPTLLFIATVVAYGAVPGNLAVLFLSLSLLKAMTYSMHDPAKELLYMPTSDAIKFRAKFWIDVVGARVAKAAGSSINTLAGSVDGSIQLGAVPSLLTAGALWYVCYNVGIAFDRLVKEDRVVGQDERGLDRSGKYRNLHTTCLDSYELNHANAAEVEGNDNECCGDFELKPLI